MLDYIFNMNTVTIFILPPVSDYHPTLLTSSLRYFFLAMLSIVVERSLTSFAADCPILNIITLW